MSINKSYYSQIHKILRQGKLLSLKQERKKKSLDLQGKTDQVYSRPIHRKLAGQKGLAGYIECAELIKILQPRILYPASLSFKIEGVIKSFPAKQKLKDFMTTKPVLVF